MTFRIKCALCIAQLCAASVCVAADDHLFEDHHSHEHGVATLDIAIDGSELHLQFRSPAMNLLGFEHAPRTTEDEAAVTKAIQLLRSPAAQFPPSAGARCQVAKTEVTAPDWKRSTEHSEFEAEYVFRCERPDLLQQLQVRLLESLREGVKVEVQVTSSEGQHAAEVRRSSPRVSLRGRR